MSEGRAASLEGSLLARKGAAAPAIPDESPLVLNLQEHRPGLDGPTALSDDKQKIEAVGLVAAVGNGLSRMKARWAAISSRVRLMVAGVATVAIIAILWPSDNSGGTSQIGAHSTPSSVSAVKPDTPVLKLTLTAEPETPAKRAEPPKPLVLKPLVTTIAVPATAALVVVEPPAVNPVIKTPASPSGDTTVLANAPSSETSPSTSGVNPTPEIRTTLPKTVSPVPVPRAKPDVAAATVGPYAVQLASIASEKRANQEAFRLQKHLGGILSGREIKVEKAVVKNKGTRYRLRTSGYRSYADARAACKQVAALKVNCLAIRR